MQDRLNQYTTFLDLPQEDLDNLTPIQFAAKHGVVNFIEERLAASDPNQLPDILEKKTPTGGFTALHYAVFFGHTTCVEALLKYGASIDKLSDLQQLPIHLALMSPKNDKEKKITLFTLLNLDPTILNRRNLLGDTVAHLAAEANLPEILNVIKVINEQLFSIPNNSGMTPLLVSLCNHATNATKVLLEHTTALQAKDSKLRNALHYAALYSDAQCVETILPYFDKNERDHDGNTASDYAARRKNTEMLTILGEVGLELR